MGEQDSPAVIDPLMPVHGALCGFRLEVWDHIAQAKYLRIAEPVRQRPMPRTPSMGSHEPCGIPVTVITLVMTWDFWVPVTSWSYYACDSL